MDRRVVWAIVLMMIIAIVPSFFLKSPTPPPAAVTQSDSVGRRAAGQAGRDSAGAAAAPAGTDTSAGPPARPPAAADSAAIATREDTVVVRSERFTYRIGTRGARVLGAELARYRSTVPGATDAPVELLRPGSDLLAPTVVVGSDTLHLADWVFTPSATELSVNGPTPLRLTAERGRVRVELTYTFSPDDYQIDVRGRVQGLGPNGGLLLLGMGPGLANTEADSAANMRELAIVTKAGDTERENFRSLEAGRPDTLAGPFDWVAVKSKYFVTAVLAFDSTGGRRISGVMARPPANAGDDPVTADVQLSMPVAASGEFSYRLYAGPMEYPRLRAIGQQFDDVNPYGWPGFRGVIRFFAVPVRWALVAMHENLHLSYGLVLIVFGILVRIVLWPLNQKAMRSSTALQALQPEIQAIQSRHKDNPQAAQQAMFALYKEHGVNPLGGCWPMLLPMPVLFALFFVFQNAIEFRGVPFLWLPDLSRPDPFYVIPLLLGISTYGLSKVGQLGMEPNPQMKMMLYFMPVMMTVIFLNFPSGLNLYYLTSNLASIPQQFLIARDRQRRTARAIVEVKTKEPTRAGKRR